MPKPRVNLTRFHGAMSIYVGSQQQTALVRHTRSARKRCEQSTPQTPAERHRAMSWAQRLKRVFQIDIERCEHGGRHERRRPVTRQSLRAV